MAEAKLFEVANEKGTPIKTMEGSAKVAYKYEGEATFTEVLAKPVEKGVVKSEEGKFPDAAPGKTIRETKIEVIPTNYPFYKSRTATKVTSKGSDLLVGDKFKLEGTTPRTFKERDDAKSNAITNKLAALTTP
jgi:hypothetical protein